MNNPVQEVESFVRKKIKYLTMNPNRSMIISTLSKLRRGVGKEPGSMPDLWDITLNELPESLLGCGDQPTRGECAVYTALTLFALHQQGLDAKQKSMNVEGLNLGSAVRKLIMRNADREVAVTRRFIATITADEYEELTWHLRGLVQLLRAGDVGLDYSQLAMELYRFQNSENRDSIRLQWGRHFYRTQSDNTLVEE